MIGAGIGLFASISNTAKQLFSGEARQARQERKELKKTAKAAAKDAKEAAKKAITGGATTGAKVGSFFNNVVEWVKKNYLYILIGVGAVLVIWFMFFKKKRSPRRRTARRGSTTMRARMAKVRSFRRRKRK